MNRRLELWRADTGARDGSPWVTGYPSWVLDQLSAYRSDHGLHPETPLSDVHDAVTDWIERRVKSRLIDLLISATAEVAE